MPLSEDSLAVTLSYLSGLADNTSMDQEYKLSCLLLVHIAVSLPTLALDPNSLYSQQNGGASSFAHSFPAAAKPPDSN